MIWGSTSHFPGISGYQGSAGYPLLFVLDWLTFFGFPDHVFLITSLSQGLS